MASRKSKDTLIWLGLGIFAFVCFMALSGCEGVSYPPKKDSNEWKARESIADGISCHWSTIQVREGACWCIENYYRQGGIVLAPNKFCGRD